MVSTEISPNQIDGFSVLTSRKNESMIYGFYHVMVLKYSKWTLHKLCSQKTKELKWKAVTDIV